MPVKHAAKPSGIGAIILAGSVLATAAASIAGTALLVSPHGLLHRQEKPTTTMGDNVARAMPNKDPQSSGYALAEKAIQTWALSANAKPIKFSRSDNVESTKAKLTWLLAACSSNQLFADLANVKHPHLLWSWTAKSQAGEHRFAQFFDPDTKNDYYFAVSSSKINCAGAYHERGERMTVFTDDLSAGASVLAYAALSFEQAGMGGEAAPTDEQRRSAIRRLRQWRDGPMRTGADNISSASPAPATAPGSVGLRRMSTSDFYEAVQGQTKDGVKAKLGSPSNIIDQRYDHRQSWFYWDDKLQLFDEDAGTTVRGSARVTFSTDTGTVVDAGY